MRERERYIQHSFLEFWLVDHPEQGMPGAWCDYDKNSYDNKRDEDSKDDMNDYENNNYGGEDDCGDEDRDKDKGGDRGGDQDHDEGKNENFDKYNKYRHDSIDKA